MKWEYKYVILDPKFTQKATFAYWNEELQKMGDDGWELVNFLASSWVNVGIQMIFKRPLPDCGKVK